MQIETLTGADLAPVLPELARLRIEVFREWPYLYDGTLSYEKDYLATFAAAPDAVIMTARDGGDVVGCATGCALTGEHADFIAPVEAAGLDPADTFYFGESVLRAAQRGQGIGHAFFDQREAHARARGYRRTCFCAVVRPDDHPRRPEAPRDLEPFWWKRGYVPLHGARAHFAWRDLGETGETRKPLQVWWRPLA